LINEFLLPFTLNIGMFMAFPYLAVFYFGPLLFNATIVHQIERYIYSIIISFMLLLAFVIFQIKQLRLLFDHVRDEKYLVGRRLINFERWSQSNKFHVHFVVHRCFVYVRAIDKKKANKQKKTLTFPSLSRLCACV